jgi:hypothetical protein
MGQQLTVGVVLTLVCNLVVLPALIDWKSRPAAARPRRRGPPTVEAPPARRWGGWGRRGG